MKYLLDAGHGGDDPGAVNDAEGLAEEDITLAVVKRLGEKLEEAGHAVLYTRIGDTYISPPARLALIRKWKPGAFISVHCNASKNDSAHGTETWYADENDLELAQNIQAAMIEATGLADRGVKKDVRGLAVLKDYDTPAVLVEIGFIRSEEDVDVITDTELIAEALFQGITA